MSNLDPIVLIQRSDGYTLEVPRSTLATDYAALGFTEVRRVYADDDTDAGAWDTGKSYAISHPDGMRFATTYQNWAHRYYGLGYTIGRAEDGGAPPVIPPFTIGTSLIGGPDQIA